MAEELNPAHMTLPGTAWLWWQQTALSSGDAVEVEPEYAVVVDTLGGCADMGGELVQVDVGQPLVWVAVHGRH